MLVLKMLKYPWLITNHCKILYSKRLPVCMSWDQASYFYKLDMTSWDQPWQLSSGLSSCYLPVINRSRWFTPGRHALSVSSSFLMSSPPHLVFNKKMFAKDSNTEQLLRNFTCFFNFAAFSAAFCCDWIFCCPLAMVRI